MRCPYCGNEVREDERHCSNCGQNNKYYVEKKNIENVETYQQPYSDESGRLATCALIFGILGGLLGLMFSITGLRKYKTPGNRTKCKIGLGFFIARFVINLLLGIVLA